jgi:hypothetical protein
MWVQWASIGADILQKNFFKFLVIYCLIQSLKALLNIKERVNEENPILILFSFGKVLPNLIKINKTPLLLRNLFMNKNIVRTLASEGKRTKHSHENIKYKETSIQMCNKNINHI